MVPLKQEGKGARTKNYQKGTDDGRLIGYPGASSNLGSEAKLASLLGGRQCFYSSHQGIYGLLLVSLRERSDGAKWSPRPSRSDSAYRRIRWLASPWTTK